MPLNIPVLHYRIVSLLILLSVSSIQSELLFCQPYSKTRPSVGVVLSGGAAKGIAHIGVLKVIEEAGIPVDYIAGTSMGAIIGGLYAMGYDASSIEKITVEQNWNKLLSDNISRTDLSIEEKPEEDLYFISFPYGKTGVRVPAGIILGQNIENLLNKLCFPAYQIRDFNQLPIPFLCVGMDILTGKEVVMRDGYLPYAMRASMAIPSLFEPIERDSFLLVDGGVINNFPVDHLIEMGADIIIGVDVGFQKPQQTGKYDIFKIFEQTILVASEGRNNQNRASCDILIIPDLTGLGASNFSAADTFIARGEKAARSMIAALNALSDSLHDFPSFFHNKPTLPSVDSVFLKEIEILGLKKVSAQLLTGKLELDMLTWLKPSDIETAINNAFSSLYFTKVSYELQKIENDKTPNSVRLTIHVAEKEGGMLRVGLNYNSDFRSSIILNTTFRNLLFDGSKLSVNLGLGENPKLLASFFKNNGVKPGFGADLEGQNMNVYRYNGIRKTATIDYTSYSTRLYTQSIFKNSFALGGGFEYEIANLKTVVGDLLPDKESTRFYNGYFFMNIDRYDDISYPTTGSRFYALYKLVNARNIRPVHFISLHYEKAVHLAKRFTLIPSVFGGYSSADTTTVVYQFYVGGMNQLCNKGLVSFVGLDFMQVNNRVVTTIGLNLQYNFWRNNYIVLKANAGSTAWTINNLFERGSGLLGFGITIGNNSVIGPIEITLMASNAHHNLLSFFNIGYWF